MKKAKKDSYQDFKAKFMLEAIYGVVILFVFALISIYGYNIYNTMNAEIQGSDDISATTKLHSATQYERYDDSVDGLVLMIAIFLLIVFLVISYFSYDNPVLIILLIILLLAMLVVGAILSNAWEEVTEDSEVSTLADNLPVTDNLLNNYLMYVLVIFFGCGIVYFMRSKS